MAEARKKPQSDLVEGVFCYPPPSAAPAAAAPDDMEQEREQEGQTGGGEKEAEFGIVGALFTQELTWRDVVVVLQGLQAFCEGGKGRYWVEALLFLQDEERGVLGSGSLRTRTGEGT